MRDSQLFTDRMHVCKANLGGGLPAVDAHTHYSHGDAARVQVAEFAAFAAECGWDIPEELRTIARTTAPVEAVLAPQASPEPVQAAPAVKRWTDEALAELAAYREKHKTKKAAEHFGISESLVRRLLPREKKPTATPFSGLGSRAR